MNELKTITRLEGSPNGENMLGLGLGSCYCDKGRGFVYFVNKHTFFFPDDGIAFGHGYIAPWGDSRDASFTFNPLMEYIHTVELSGDLFTLQLYQRLAGSDGPWVPNGQGSFPLRPEDFPFRPQENRRCLMPIEFERHRGGVDFIERLSWEGAGHYPNVIDFDRHWGSRDYLTDAYGVNQYVDQENHVPGLPIVISATGVQSDRESNGEQIIGTAKRFAWGNFEGTEHPTNARSNTVYSHRINAPLRPATGSFELLGRFEVSVGTSIEGETIPQCAPDGEWNIGVAGIKANCSQFAFAVFDALHNIDGASEEVRVWRVRNGLIGGVFLSNNEAITPAAGVVWSLKIEYYYSSTRQTIDGVEYFEGLNVRIYPLLDGVEHDVGLPSRTGQGQNFGKLSDRARLVTPRFHISAIRYGITHPWTGFSFRNDMFDAAFVKDHGGGIGLNSIDNAYYPDTAWVNLQDAQIGKWRMRVGESIKILPNGTGEFLQADRFVVAAGSLPSGLRVSSTHAITGTADAPGTGTVEFSHGKTYQWEVIGETTSVNVTFQGVTTTVNLDANGVGTATATYPQLCTGTGPGGGPVAITGTTTITVEDLGNGDYTFSFTTDTNVPEYRSTSFVSLIPGGVGTTSIIATGAMSPLCFNRPVTIVPAS